jgi:mannose-1-phosphate guanylyltransferase
MLHVLVMAGGGGTRFWPRSRQKRPKQFLNLAGQRTLLQQALDRIAGMVPADRSWIITGEDYRLETQRQLPDLPEKQIIGEPFGRDTAPCVALGAALIAAADSNGTMIVMSADHLIEPTSEFQRGLGVAQRLAEQNPRALITFGIRPSFAATGYGYIQRGDLLDGSQGISIYAVKRFREKPTAPDAEQFLASGEYFWNSGIFVWKVSAIMSALQEYQPRIFTAAQTIAQAWNGEDRAETLRQEYQALERISIDYAVMERARQVFVIEAPYHWDDVGSWLALERLHAQDPNGNTVLGTHIGINTNHCVIRADAGHLIATVGVNRLLIIQDGDVTLVADAEQEAAIKQLVGLLKQKGMEKYL